MATYFARKAGNINASDVWATTPSGTASAVTFASGDVLMANSFAITVNVSTNLGASGEVRNDTTGGATAGGSFALSSGVTLTANSFGNAAGNTCVTFSGTTASIIGNATGGTSGGGVSYAVTNNSGGTLNITGTCTGGTISNSPNPRGVGNLLGGTINITGDCKAGNGGGAGAWNAGSGTINITGNCSGENGMTGSGVLSGGAVNGAAGTLNITGTCTGGTNTTSFSAGAINASTGTMLITGTIQASEFGPGVSGANRAQVTLLTGPFLISPTFGVNPIGCTAWRWASALNNQTYIEVGTQTLLQKRNLVTPDNATNFPDASDVRSGVAYGIGGVVSGTCAVPDPAAVALGVPVSDTVGTLASQTAAQIASAVRTELATELGCLDASISSRLAPNGTLATVTTLTNAPSVPTPSQIASQVRTELGTELGRIDTTISSRLAPNGTLATVTTLTNAPSVPSAAAIADEVRVELATELARIDAPISGAGNAPSAATVASAVRTELATELARVDAAVSTRLAGSAYTAPANSDISTIKAKTDNLPASPAATGDIPTAAQNATAVWSKPANELTVADSIGERAKQQSTVAITGAQLAAALS